MTIFCCKCGDPCRDSRALEAHWPDTSELCCVCCSDDEDPLDCIKQEAFAEGWHARGSMIRCPDCGSEAIEEAIGQVCGQCGRGIIEEARL